MQRQVTVVGGNLPVKSTISVFGKANRAADLYVSFLLYPCMPGELKRLGKLRR